MRTTEPPLSNRLLDMPDEDVDNLNDACRLSVVVHILGGRSEDETYRRCIDVALDSARLEGCDDGDQEVMAALTRRQVASALQECRAEGLIPAEA